MARLSPIALLPLALAALVLPAAAQQAQLSGASEACATMPQTAVALIVLGVLLAVVLSLNQIAQLLKNSRWSLANALSEVIELKVPLDAAWTASQGDLQASLESRPQGAVSSAAETPTLLRVLEPSSSRLIALVGMVVILLMYVGFGLFALYTFGLCTAAWRCSPPMWRTRFRRCFGRRRAPTPPPPAPPAPVAAPPWCRFDGKRRSRGSRWPSSRRCGPAPLPSPRLW
jgi:hypothetical protein